MFPSPQSLVHESDRHWESDREERARDCEWDEWEAQPRGGGGDRGGEGAGPHRGIRRGADPAWAGERERGAGGGRAETSYAYGCGIGSTRPAVHRRSRSRSKSRSRSRERRRDRRNSPCRAVGRRLDREGAAWGGAGARAGQEGGGEPRPFSAGLGPSPSCRTPLGPLPLPPPAASSAPSPGQARAPLFQLPACQPLAPPRPPLAPPFQNSPRAQGQSTRWSSVNPFLASGPGLGPATVTRPFVFGSGRPPILNPFLNFPGPAAPPQDSGRQGLRPSESLRLPSSSPPGPPGPAPWWPPRPTF